MLGPAKEFVRVRVSVNINIVQNTRTEYRYSRKAVMSVWQVGFTFWYRTIVERSYDTRNLPSYSYEYPYHTSYQYAFSAPHKQARQPGEQNKFIGVRSSFAEARIFDFEI